MDGGASRRSLVGSSRLVPPCRGWRGRPWHVCSLCSSCAPLAEGLHHRRWPSTTAHTAPHRPADASRSVPIAGGEVELALRVRRRVGHAAGFGQGASRALCSPRLPGCAPGQPTPPRRARPTRRAPHLSQAVRSSWHCRAARVGHAAGFGQGRVARVVLAETARVRPGAEPHPCVSSRRRA